MFQASGLEGLYEALQRVLTGLRTVLLALASVLAEVVFQGSRKDSGLRTVVEQLSLSLQDVQDMW